MQLAPHVGVHQTTLRRHLHRLAHDGLIRIEERPSIRFGGQPTRAYFIIERAEAAPAEPNITRAEAA
jgi:predicted ArsR family transcriptional regulator